MEVSSRSLNEKLAPENRYGVAQDPSFQESYGTLRNWDREMRREDGMLVGSNGSRTRTAGGG